MNYRKILATIPLAFLALIWTDKWALRGLVAAQLIRQQVHSAQIPLVFNTRTENVPFYAKYTIPHDHNYSQARCPRKDKASKRILQLHNNTGVGGRTKYLLESFFGIVGAILFSIAYIGYPTLDYLYSVTAIATNDTVNIQGLGRQDDGSTMTGDDDDKQGRFLLVSNLAVPINDCLEWAICLAANQMTGRLETTIAEGILNVFSGRRGILTQMWKTYRRKGTDRIYTTDAAVSCDQFVCQPFRFTVKILIYLLDWNAIIKQTL